MDKARTCWDKLRTREWIAKARTQIRFDASPRAADRLTYFPANLPLIGNATKAHAPAGARGAYSLPNVTPRPRRGDYITATLGDPYPYATAPKLLPPRDKDSPSDFAAVSNRARRRTGAVQYRCRESLLAQAPERSRRRQAATDAAKSQQAAGCQKSEAGVKNHYAAPQFDGPPGGTPGYRPALRTTRPSKAAEKSRGWPQRVARPPVPRERGGSRGSAPACRVGAPRAREIRCPTASSTG